MKLHVLRRLSLVGLLSWAAACSAALNEAEWKHRQAVQVPKAGLVKVAVPLETLDELQSDFRDLRLVSPDGGEVPFALVRPARSGARWEVPRRFEVSLTDTGTVIAVEAPELLRWETLEIATSTPRFHKAARLETTEDGTTWEQRAEGVPYFRQDGIEQTSFRLGGKPVRGFRVTLDDRTPPRVVITGVRLLRPPEDAETRQVLPVEILRHEEFAGDSVLTFRLPAANLDIARLQLQVEDPFFTRPARVVAPIVHGEEIRERALGTGTLYRIQLDDSTAAETLEIPIDASVSDREIRLHLENGDSPPLRIAGATVARDRLYAVFSAATPGAFVFWSGNDLAVFPRYDVSAFAGQLRKLAATSVDAKPIAENSSYVRPDPLAGIPIESAPLEVEAWRYRRGIVVSQPGTQVLELDLAALAAAGPSLADVRVVRGSQWPSR